MSGTPFYIQFEDVQVMYNDLVAGLRRVTFDVSQGEFVYLCGPTGSGKSTIIKLLSRQLRPTKGQVILDGQDLGALSQAEVPYLRRKMGIVPQDFALLPNKKVWENVAYAMRAVGRTKKEVRQRVPDLLEKVHILHRADAFPGQLSGGEQQRVAIGRALINDPPLLLADEPTGNLDAGHSEEIMEILCELNGNGTTVLVATHDLTVLRKFRRRVLSLESGHLVGDGIGVPDIDFELERPEEPVVAGVLGEDAHGDS